MKDDPTHCPSCGKPGHDVGFCMGSGDVACDMVCIACNTAWPLVPGMERIA